MLRADLILGLRQIDGRSSRAHILLLGVGPDGGTVTGDHTDNALRILVAIDLKAGTERLLAEAQRYGQALNAIIDIIHVAEPDLSSPMPRAAIPGNQV